MNHAILHEDFDGLIDRLGTRLVCLYDSTILVTGCYGFIGSYVVDFFAYLNDRLAPSDRIKIIGLDNFLVGDQERLAHLSRRADIGLYDWDIAAPYHALPRFVRPYWILNFAGVASPIIYKKYPIETLRVAIHGTWNLLDYIATNGHVCGMLHMSSSEVYGDSDILPTPESYVGRVPFLGPRSCYDSSKQLSETLCKTYVDTHGINVKVCRPFNIYGPGHKNDGRIIPQLMDAVLNDKPLTIYGDGKATRSYCYVADAVAQMLAVLIDGVPGKPYNVGDDGSEVSLIELVELAQQRFGGRPRVEFTVDELQTRDAPSRRRPDITQVRELIGEPMLSLADGLERTYQSFSA